MIYVVDNFLSTEQFKEFSDLALKKSTKWGSYLPEINSVQWSKFVQKQNFDDFEDAVNKKFGPIVYSVTEKITSFLQTKIQDLPNLKSVGFLYQTNGYKIKPHLDNIYKNQKFYTKDYLKQNVSAFLYSHKTWDSKFGGRLCFENYEIEPNPNRLVLYTLDESHSCTVVENAQVLRILFKVNFVKYTEEMVSADYSDTYYKTTY